MSAGAFGYIDGFPAIETAAAGVQGRVSLVCPLDSVFFTTQFPFASIIGYGAGEAGITVLPEVKRVIIR